ncbi:MAG: hypothetical protein IJ851_01630 [Eubacterium sp.]|nr:hypothetical protein [Eubacterium sp.]
MPYINVKTNSKLVSTCADELKSELGRAITAIPGKSEAWLMINIDEPGKMYFKGDGADCAMFEVSSFGSASDSAYDELTKRLCDISQKYLGVSPDRTYVKYTEIDHWGYNGFNF